MSEKKGLGGFTILKSPSVGNYEFCCALGLLFIGWLVIPIKFKAELTQWNNYKVLPDICVCAFLFAFTLIFRRSKWFGQIPVRQRLIWYPVISCEVLLLWFYPIKSVSNLHYLFIGLSLVVLLGLGGKKGLLLVLPSFLLLLLCPGIPGFIEDKCIRVLKEISINVDLFFAQTFLDPEYFRSNYYLLLPEMPGCPEFGLSKQLCVANECSGYRSFVGMMIFGWWVVFSREIRKYKRVMIFAAAVILAVMGNQVRVILSTVFIHYNLDGLTKALPHAMLGHLMLIIEMIILYFITKKIQVSKPVKK